MFSRLLRLEKDRFSLDNILSSDVGSRSEFSDKQPARHSKYVAVDDVSAPVMLSGFQILHWNCHLTTSHEDVVDIINKLNSEVQVIGICESFISEQCPASLFNFPGYTLISKNRSLMGRGGLAFIIKDDIKFKVDYPLFLYFTNMSSAGCVKNIEKIKMVLEEDYHASGLNYHFLKVGWYNEKVTKPFRLNYDPNAAAFVVISSPEMFEKTFIPFLLKRHCIGEGDPLDESLANHLKSLEHRIYGVCLHPRYGGWFALRGVIVFPDVLVGDVPRPTPVDTLVSDEKKKELLEKYNFNWEDWSFRDVIPVESRYSELQKQYFSTVPAERTSIVERIRSSCAKYS
ncbi:cyanocobalamin reductase / alkylcobalamin dealkylase-like isoform X2 [Artemia franciscana]|uniref:cyanocobalamin reductase / alkylcobalamin dealkylase-like isoform X2 n=1 Tax=Artemia franciscana TaxID=6661 RepID=UPI0032DBA98F